MTQFVESILDAISWNVFSAGKELKGKKGGLIH